MEMPPSRARAGAHAACGHDAALEGQRSRALTLLRTFAFEVRGVEACEARACGYRRCAHREGCQVMGTLRRSIRRGSSSETMRRRLLCVLALSVFHSDISGCTARQEPQPQSGYRPTATIKDIMVSIIDPEADVLWNSVATIISAAGTEEREPKTDEEWAAVRQSAIQLVEATNLLRIPGRQVAKPGEKSENPRIELEPETMQKLIADDPASWTMS